MQGEVENSNRSSYQLEVEEKKNARLFKQKFIDRFHKDLDMLGILNGEGLDMNRNRWREVVVAAQELYK